jgi:hypothetical protein
MARPKSLTEIPLIPGENIIKSDEFVKAYVGIVDREGRIPKVGKEYAGREVWVYLRKTNEELK